MLISRKNDLEVELLYIDQHLMYLANVTTLSLEATQTAKMNSRTQKSVNERFEQISGASGNLETLKSQLQEKLAALESAIEDVKQKLDQVLIHYSRSRS